MRRDQYRKPDGTIGGYNPELAAFVPRDWKAEERAVDERLLGVHIDEASFRRFARRTPNGNFWRDYAIRFASEKVQDLDALHRWNDDGGAQCAT